MNVVVMCVVILRVSRMRLLLSGLSEIEVVCLVVGVVRKY